MRKLVILFSMALFVLSASLSSAVCTRTEPLFVIRHSENGNAVHYDACLDGDTNLDHSDPVVAYWVLENGQKEDLIAIEKRRAYGVDLRERLGNESVLVSVVSLKEREISVKRIGSRYRALMLISGHESILEGVYLKSHDGLFGMPVVDFVELHGKTLAGGRSVSEKIDKPRI